jgi:hypothetical protein
VGRCVCVGVVCVGVSGGEVSPCTRTFQGLQSVRLWTPTILFFRIHQAVRAV